MLVQKWRRANDRDTIFYDTPNRCAVRIIPPTFARRLLYEQSDTSDRNAHADCIVPARYPARVVPGMAQKSRRRGSPASAAKTMSCRQRRLLGLAVCDVLAHNRIVFAQLQTCGVIAPILFGQIHVRAFSATHFNKNSRSFFRHVLRSLTRCILCCQPYYYTLSRVAVQISSTCPARECLSDKTARWQERMNGPVYHATRRRLRSTCL